MTETLHLGLPLIAAAQAQKHVTHNQPISALSSCCGTLIEWRVRALQGKKVQCRQ
ncbi:hypothetical protein [Rhodoplanes sp. SY1]|uniref:hypothetical protein n=1 Tax=Rhodoplanes sp. SY1 TaxID=3166646 RepID=UPI0038B6685F